MFNDSEAEPPQIYLRNYETTKVRCERAQLANKASILEKTIYDPKKIVTNGNNLRPKLLSKEKHMPLKLAEVTDSSRIKDGIAERTGVSLRESFNLEIYQNPVWKSVDKKKWRTRRGISYEGQQGNHITKLIQTNLGGTSKQNASIAAHRRGQSW